MSSILEKLEKIRFREKNVDRRGYDWAVVQYFLGRGQGRLLKRMWKSNSNNEDYGLFQSILKNETSEEELMTYFPDVKKEDDLEDFSNLFLKTYLDEVLKPIENLVGDAYAAIILMIYFLQNNEIEQLP